MKRKYSLAVHDLKVSEDESTVETLKRVADIFGIPITVHLVFDNTLPATPALLHFLQENMATGAIEVVFHGLSHRCPETVSKIFAFYHKYQAEYLEDSELLRGKTSIMYTQATTLFSYNLGICPPCWISHKRNFLFFRTLKPAYIEKLLSVSFQRRKVFSPVISLGSPNDGELFFLKVLAWFMYSLSGILPNSHTRIAIHPCDLEKPSSLAFFKRKVKQLQKKGFEPVLLKYLQ
jgi:hypothetical protein